MLRGSVLAALSGTGLAALFLSPDPDWSAQAERATAARGSHHGLPFTAPATNTALQELQGAQRAAAELQAEVTRRRAELAARIGPRGLTLGAFTLPDGRTVPIHVASLDAAKKLWRRLPEELQGERLAVFAAVRDACAWWDAEAERCGLKELERRAAGARDRARALLGRAAGAAA